MSEQNVSASAASVDAKADTKFEVLYREHREAKLEARRLQGEVDKWKGVLAESDQLLADDIRSLNSAHERDLAAADEKWQDELAESRAVHSRTAREFKAAGEEYAKAIKRVESKEETLRDEFNADLRNQ